MEKTKLLLQFQSTPVTHAIEEFLAADPDFDITPQPLEADIILFDGLPSVAILKKTHSQNSGAQIVCFLGAHEKLHNLPFSVKTLLKPFQLQFLQEFLQNPVPQSVIQFSAFTLYPGQRRLVFKNAEPITLTEKEVSLLVFLDKEKGDPISRDDLLKKVWGYGEGITTHTIETHIYKLKQKLKNLSDEDVILLDRKGYFLKSKADKTS